MKVNYIGACFDSSGYAQASRNYISALESVGIDVAVKATSFEKQRPNLESFGEHLNSLTTKEYDAKIQIIHLTPENYSHFYDANKYNIAYTTWETSKLPDNWIPALKRMQEIWVPCQHNVEIFESAGLTNVRCIPHTFNPPEEKKDISPIVNKAEDEFMFYSIFQWTERKNPIGLLKAYLSEFSVDEKVCLVIKTYFMNPDNAQEARQLKETIKSIKTRMYLKDYPKVLLITNLLSESQLHSLHMSGDCYVSLHRCEGFGMPIVEAMSHGKPTIATNYGGPSDFGISSDREIMYRINYLETPCHGMPWPIYTAKMNWAEPDILQARKAMREVFENQQEAKAMGLAAKDWVEKELSYERIGSLMKQRLEVIEKENL